MRPPTAPVSVRRGVEGLAAPVARDRACSVEDDAEGGRLHEQHAAGEGERQLVERDALRRLVDRDERSRAGRIDRDTWATQVQRMRDPVRRAAR